MTGQKIGIDAHIMARSISRQDRMMLIGVHQVKSGYGERPALWSTIECKRHTDIMTTLSMLVFLFPAESFRTYTAPNVNTPPIASTFLTCKCGVRNRIRGVAKTAKSKNMFVDEWAWNMAMKLSRSLKPKP